MKELGKELCWSWFDPVVSQPEVALPVVDEVPVVEGQGIHVCPVNEHLTLEYNLMMGQSYH